MPAVLTQFQFQPGLALQDGNALQQLVNQEFGVLAGIVALAGGGQAGATQLNAAFNIVETVATASDSVMLPPANVGASCYVYNATAATLAIFGQVGDTIATSQSNTQQATATGITQATTLTALYICFKAGQWKQFLTA